MERHTQLCLVFLPTLLSCSNCFFPALQQNRAQSRLLYLLHKESKSKGRVTVHNPSGPPSWSLSRSQCIMMQIGVLPLPLDRMLHCPSQGYPPPPAFLQASLKIRWYPFILLGGERLKVSCPRTQHIDLPDLEHRPLATASPNKGTTLRTKDVNTMLVKGSLS